MRAPRGTATRPTSDKVREAIFDVIGSIVELEGTTVADLFAGSGAMGIEALSRGAKKAVFVDRSPAAIAMVQANLDSTGLAGPEAQVVQAEAAAWLAEGDGHFDVAFVDPPYAYVGWEQVFAGLDCDLAVLESDRALEVPESWEIFKSKRYGGTLVTVVRPAGANDQDHTGGNDKEQKGIS